MTFTGFAMPRLNPLSVTVNSGMEATQPAQWSVGVKDAQVFRKTKQPVQNA